MLDRAVNCEVSIQSITQLNNPESGTARMPKTLPLPPQTSLYFWSHSANVCVCSCACACMCVCVCVLVAQFCLILCDPMDCGSSGSSVHGILQPRRLEWLAIPFSRGTSQPRDWTRVTRIVSRFFTVWVTGKAPFSQYVLWNDCIVSLSFEFFFLICS